MRWNKPLHLDSKYSIVEINSQNFHLLFDFLRENESLFEIVIHSEIANILELLKTNNIFIHVIVLEEQIISAYFFRKTCTFIDTDLEVLTCFASINQCDEKDIFIHGFKLSFWKIAEKHHFGYAEVENISHNHTIIENLVLKTKPQIISPTAYFFYNFAYPTFHAEKVFILN